MEFAKYIGTADERMMLERDWKAAGVDDQDTVVWNAMNGHTVSRERFSDDAWAILANDPSIVFTGERPKADEVQEAAVNAAKARLLARQGGQTVLHSQDQVPAAGPEGTSGHTPGATVQSSDAASRG